MNVPAVLAAVVGNELTGTGSATVIVIVTVTARGRETGTSATEMFATGTFAIETCAIETRTGTETGGGEVEAQKDAGARPLKGGERIERGPRRRRWTM